MIIADLAVAEKRMERIELDRKRGKKPSPEEPSLLELCREMLSEGVPLRNNQELASNPALRGFTFLTAKPMLVIINNAEEDEALPEWACRPDNAAVLLVRGRLEMDIASMESADAVEFRQAYNIQESALDRVIESSHALLSRITFFTVSPEEVKAWSIPTGTPALEAAGTVHSDMQKGFIRAETVSFADLQACGSFQEAKKAGLVRLEGKEYEVQDGDIIQFRFNL
jgi:ribosome-binding ATPase YchF (GTP1/OBG family)